MADIEQNVADEASRVQSQVKSAAKHLSESASDVASRAAGKASEAWDNAKSAGRRAGSVVSDQYGQLSDRAQQAYGQGRDVAVEWEESFEGFVQRKPITAVLAGVGVGLVLGVLLSRKR